VEPHVPNRQSQPVKSAPLVYPSLYNGPINYYARLIREEQIILEQYDHYSKQTYRNRCRLMGPNGIMTLSVPVKKRRGGKTLMRDILVDYDTPWNTIHWRSMVGAYAASPFFNLMREEYFPFYHRRFRYLIDLNMGLTTLTLGLIGADIPATLTQEFCMPSGENAKSPWYHSKKKVEETDPGFHPPEYHQVFSERFGFRSNLSILDLLFNEGPDTLTRLKQSLRT
jgi:hypothetical protein